MRPRSSVRLRWRAAALMAVVAMTGAVSIGPAISAASAHSKLVSSTPQDGAVLETAPALVEFTFDEELLDGTTVISINDDRGNPIATTPVEPTGTTISAPWPDGAGVGTFQVAYRIVSADGHPVSGAITFQVADSGASSTFGPRSEPAAVPLSSATPTDDGIPRVLVAVVLATGVAIVVTGALVLRRRRARGH